MSFFDGWQILIGHLEAYQNHPKAPVNFRTGTSEDLLQACRQYEQVEIQRRAVVGRKPVVRHLASGSGGLSKRQEAASAMLIYRDSCTDA